MRTMPQVNWLRAAVREPAHFRGRTYLGRSGELFQLLVRLFQIKRYQFAQVFRAAIREIQQP